jgi:hypothetical protein
MLRQAARVTQPDAVLLRLSLSQGKRQKPEPLTARRNLSNLNRAAIAGSIAQLPYVAARIDCRECIGWDRGKSESVTT